MMKSVLIAAAFCLSISAQAKHTIEVSEPGFTADKVEYNSVTESYVVVNPKYFINAKEALKVLWDGTVSSEDPKVMHSAKHLCSFLGLTGGKVISYTKLNWQHECVKSISISKEGSYGKTMESRQLDYHGCRVIDFLECKGGEQLNLKF